MQRNSLCSSSKVSHCLQIKEVNFPKQNQWTFSKLKSIDNMRKIVFKTLVIEMPHKMWNCKSIRKEEKINLNFQMITEIPWGK